MEVSAKLGDGSKSATVEYNFGANLEESVALFTKEVVHSLMVADGKVTVQAGIRRLLNAGKTQAEIQEYFNTYKLGVKAAPVTGDPIQKLLSKFGTMTPEEQADVLNKLREAAKAKK